MTKVLIISKHPKDDNRIIRHIKTLTKNLYEVTYINVTCMNLSNNEVYNNLEYVNYDFDMTKKKICKSIFIFKKIEKVIKSCNFDIVHVHDPHFLKLSKISKKCGSKFIFDKHESYDSMTSIACKLYTFFEIHYKKFIDATVLVNNSQIDYVKSINPDSEIVLVPNYQEKSIYGTNADIQKDMTIVKVIYVGSLSEGTREILLMLDLMDTLLTNYRNLRFILGGKTKNEGVNEKILSMAAIHINFEYMGYVCYEEVINKTKSSDIGLYFQKRNSNNIGSSPNKIFEYILSGCLVFAIGRFENFERIHNFAGYVFDFDTEKSVLLSTFEKLLIDPQSIEVMKKNSRLLGREFTYESVSGRYISLYNNLLNVG